MTVMPLREWLKPPRSLLLVLYLSTLIAVSSLIWFGLRLLQQEQAVAEEHRQEQFEREADRVAASMRLSLAEARERLSVWAITPPREDEPRQGVLLSLKRDSVSAFPEGRLIYWPVPQSDKEAPASAFAQGERLEFIDQQEDRAAKWYRALADSHVSSAIRAGALLRLGRVLRNSGQKRERSLVYERLAAFGESTVAGVPADLVARHELCELLGRAGEAESLKKDLLLGRWHLSRGQFQFYWAEATRLSGHDDPLPLDRVALADAAADAWSDTRNDPAVRGERTLWMDGRAFLEMWQLGPEGRSMMVVPIGSTLEQLSRSDEVYWAVEDVQGRILAGRRDGVGRAAVRTAAEGQLPWTLYVTGLRSPGDKSLLIGRRFVLAAVVILVLCVLAGSYFIARAIQKEMAVAQLQANFVSAVSHEFRSPLTSIRQLSEILAQGRASDARRQIYYETLVGETNRLQRLVETLLDFGRMEAGARRYQFQKLEAADLARQVRAEFEPQIAASGRHIELKGPLEQCAMQADRDALAVALRNLVDNALKYSPNCPGVWVEWGRENGFVAISVRDQGEGIPASERKAIFQKFFRGSAAAAGKVKGTGVGLAIARQIVVAHSGEIKVISEPGQGSTFTLLLPVSEKI
jgi:signal transduction histidine kinase